MSRKLITSILLLILFVACSDNDQCADDSNRYISAVDISNFPEIAASNVSFYNSDGSSCNFLQLLKTSGVNTIRLRLWVNPQSQYSGFDEVKQFASEVKALGFKLWLTLHYSDTWADPQNQMTPQLWQGLAFNALKDSVFCYTQRVVVQMQPDYIQIGNEINSGFLHPNGHIVDNYQSFIDLLEAGILAVRGSSSSTKIILHYAGFQGADWFYNCVQGLDFDIIGLSYYPIWHGKSLDSLKAQMNNLGEVYNKSVLIAETAYPFTLQWNDLTNNIVGLNEHLILPDFPATPEGQRSFIAEIKRITHEVNNGLGFCYWGAELVAWKGSESTSGSSWENQALFDFDNCALPVLAEF